MNHRYISMAILVLLISMYGFLTYGAGNDRQVQVPQLNGQGYTIERVNLEDEDPILLRSLNELMDEKRAANRSYMIARVQTGNNYVRYYDAHALNEHLFGILGTRPFGGINQYLDVMNREPITRLDYFQAENNQDFKHFCSFDQLVANTAHWRDLFYANEPAPVQQPLTPEEVLSQAYLILLTADDENREPTHDEYNQARQLFEQVANQQQDIASAAEANVQLACLYRDGSGVAANRAQAIHYFLRAAQQQANIEAALTAYNALGGLYYAAPQPEQDLALARGYYQQLIDLADQHDMVSAITLMARMFLGKLYKAEGTPAGYAQARTQYEYVIANGGDFPRDVNFARLALAAMAFEPQAGVNQADAIALCQAIVDDPQEQEYLKIEALIYIGRLYYGQAQYAQAADAFEEAEELAPWGDEQDYQSGTIDYYLGRTYFFGHGRARNDALARQYFESALNNPDMQPFAEEIQQFIDEIDDRNAQ